MARRTRLLVLGVALLAHPATATEAWLGVLDPPIWEMTFGVEDGGYEAVLTLTLRLPEREEAPVRLPPRTGLVPGGVVAQLDGPMAVCGGDAAVLGRLVSGAPR